jgi:hypothetical protein
MTETKYFTPDEAQLTLPLVKQIVKDILDTTKEIRLLAEDLEGAIEDNPEIKKLVENVNGFMRELEEIGCYYKDWNFNVGLVDFPAVIAGEEVFLCWRSDEDDIRFYHDMEKGYAGRKSIPEKYFKEQVK